MIDKEHQQQIINTEMKLREKVLKWKITGGIPCLISPKNDDRLTVFAKAVITLSTDTFFFEQALLVIITSCARGEVRNMLEQTYFNLKKLHKYANNTIRVKNEELKDGIEESIGDLMTFKRDLYELMAQMNTDDIANLIEAASSIVNEKNSRNIHQTDK